METVGLGRWNILPAEREGGSIYFFAKRDKIEGYIKPCLRSMRPSLDGAVIHILCTSGKKACNNFNI